MGDKIGFRTKPKLTFINGYVDQKVAGSKDNLPHFIGRLALSHLFIFSPDSWGGDNFRHAITLSPDVSISFSNVDAFQVQYSLGVGYQFSVGSPQKRYPFSLSAFVGNSYTQFKNDNLRFSTSNPFIDVKFSSLNHILDLGAQFTFSNDKLRSGYSIYLGFNLLGLIDGMTTSE